MLSPPFMPSVCPAALQVATASTSSVKVAMYAGVCILLLIVAGGLVMLARARLLKKDNGALPGGAGLTLQQLRDMHAAGQMSDAEFQAAKAALVATTKSAVDPALRAALATPGPAKPSARAPGGHTPGPARAPSGAPGNPVAPAPPAHAIPPLTSDPRVTLNPGGPPTGWKPSFPKMPSLAKEAEAAAPGAAPVAPAQPIPVSDDRVLRAMPGYDLTGEKLPDNPPPLPPGAGAAPRSGQTPGPTPGQVPPGAAPGPL